MTDDLSKEIQELKHLVELQIQQRSSHHSDMAREIDKLNQRIDEQVSVHKRQSKNIAEIQEIINEDILPTIDKVNPLLEAWNGGSFTIRVFKFIFGATVAIGSAMLLYKQIFHKI